MKSVLPLLLVLLCYSAFGQKTVADVVGFYLDDGSLRTNYTNAGSTLDLKPNGTFKFTYQTNSVSGNQVQSYTTEGTWKIDGETIVMNSVVKEGEQQPVTITNETWELDGRKLIDRTPLNGEKKQVFVRQMGTRLNAINPVVK